MILIEEMASKGNPLISLVIINTFPQNDSSSNELASSTSIGTMRLEQ